ncbi:MAG: DNA recombination protein RmuC [Pseudomonadota bacterium]
MDPIVIIGAAAFDAVHLALFLCLVSGVGAFFWWRSTMLREAVETGLRLDQAASDLAREGEIVAELRAEQAALAQTLAETEKALAAAEARQEAERKDFIAMANRAVESAHRSFVERADETFKRHDAAAQGRLEKLVEPIGKNFSEFKARVEALEKVRTQDKTAIFEQVKAISDQLEHTRSVTGKLVTALSAPKGGGRWGEESLRNVLEMAGLSGHADFIEQAHDARDGQTQRPDVVLRMPGGREVVIDAKVSVEDFLKAGEEADLPARREHLAAHARKMRDHVKRLSSKAYWKGFEDRVDFVAMYVPGENFYAGALEVDRDLFDYAARNRVLIVTPSTLIALAKAVAYGWRQEEAARNAKEAARLGQQLYDALRTLGGHVEKTGKQLGQAVGSYNDLVGSLQRNVLPKARRFEDLQIAESGQKPVPALPMLEDRPRLPERTGELEFGPDKDEAA